MKSFRRQRHVIPITIRTCLFVPFAARPARSTSSCASAVSTAFFCLWSLFFARPNTSARSMTLFSLYGAWYVGPSQSISQVLIGLLVNEEHIKGHMAMMELYTRKVRIKIRPRHGTYICTLWLSRPWNQKQDGQSTGHSVYHALIWEGDSSL